jgi:hypothetical protein
LFGEKFLDIIRTLLTQVSLYARMNSAIISKEGNIPLNEKFKLKAKLDPKRVFTLKVKEFELAGICFIYSCLSKSKGKGRLWSLRQPNEVITS